MTGRVVTLDCESSDTILTLKRKISGLEGYVKRELTSLEERLNNKLMKALDNPLANR